MSNVKAAVPRISQGNGVHQKKATLAASTSAKAARNAQRAVRGPMADGHSVRKYSASSADQNSREKSGSSNRKTAR